MEWLRAWWIQQQREGPLNLSMVILDGVDLTGVDLRQVTLFGASLVDTHLNDACLEGVQFDSANLNKAHLIRVQAKGAQFIEANLQHTQLDFADLRNAVLSGADLRNAALFQANLRGCRLNSANLQRAFARNVDLRETFGVHAHMQDADLEEADLRGSDLSNTDLRGANLTNALLQGYKDDAVGEVVWPVNLRRAIFDVATQLDGAKLGDTIHGFVSVADTAWNGVNLAVVDWAPLLARSVQVGDERSAIAANVANGVAAWLEGYRSAVRAYRQLATTLQDQGLNEQAAECAYRARRLQLTILRQRRTWWKVATRPWWSWFASGVLWLCSGYGYRFGNCIILYITTQLFFTTMFVCALLASSTSALRQATLPRIQVAVGEATILSITSFHGRALLPGAITTSNLLLGTIAAAEGVVGLFVEAIFVATLLQRIFR